MLALRLTDRQPIVLLAAEGGVMFLRIAEMMK
jgi:hypothetical protein